MSGRTQAPLLEVRGLVKCFPGRGGRLLGRRPDIRAVNGVSFRLARGETLGLVGESGCGKSTTARMILGLLEPDAGEVRFDGEDVGSLRGRGLRRFRGRAQMVFQDPTGALNPRMTAFQVLDETLAFHGLSGDARERRRRIGELLDRVGLAGEHASRRPHELSGGQRQRLGIARALAVEPELLVLDEPVASLDVSVQAQVVSLLRDLQRDLGLAYLFIAHDLALVARVSDRVAVMYLGRIVETGAARDVYGAPAHPYSRALLAAVPVPDPGARRRPALGGDPAGGKPSPDGCPFHPRCPHPGKDDACLRAVPELEERGDRHLAACIKPARAG